MHWLRTTQIVLLCAILACGCSSVYLVNFEKEFQSEDSRIRQDTGLTIYGYETTDGDEVDEEGCLKLVGDQLLFYPYSDPEYRPRILDGESIEAIRMEKLNPVNTFVVATVGTAGFFYVWLLLGSDTD